jgi:spore coat protein U-like protein
MKRFTFLFVMLVSLILMAGSAFAIATSPLGVSSTVSGGCGIITTPVAFPAYSSGQALDVDATGGVEVNCATGLPYNIELDGGLNPGTYPDRQMTDGLGGFLTYGLYSDAARITPWAINPDFIAGIGTGAAQPYTVYGRIPGLQTVPPNPYTDTVTATVNW